jgi:ABC-type Fe3+-siderophore transport system permease subunit
MELTMMGIVTFVTLIMGEITKRIGWVDKKYIPYQSFIIGIISGLLCWVTGLETNLFNSILTCLIASTSASGLYDTYEVHRK